MDGFEKLSPPAGELINLEGETPLVPDHPVIPFIRGDGTGPDIWIAAQPVFDAAIAAAYGGKRKIAWFEVFAGESACEKYGPNQHLPADTLNAIRQYRVAIKGPLSTPVGGGIRSLNVAMRQKMDLYACVRPVRYIPGIPSPLKEPGKLDVVIFRENTEDVYAGIEYAAETEASAILIKTLGDLGAQVRPKSAIGIKPISEFCSKRLVAEAVKYAMENDRPRVTLVHKGNIMKFTEGAFCAWGYEIAREMLGDRMVTIDQVGADRMPPAGKILVQDKIADAMFQDLILRPHWHDIITTTNLNGDYLSDAAAALVGGLGFAPGANIGDEVALFEATHGSAPHYAGQDKVNPSSVILSGVMMLDYLGWTEAARLIEKALEATIKNGLVTYDLARLMSGSTKVSCSAYGQAVAKEIAG